MHMKDKAAGCSNSTETSSTVSKNGNKTSNTTPKDQILWKAPRPVITLETDLDSQQASELIERK